jgi:hypothetical protein
MNILFTSFFCLLFALIVLRAAVCEAPLLEGMISMMGGKGELKNRFVGDGVRQERRFFISPLHNRLIGDGVRMERRFFISSLQVFFSRTSFASPLFRRISPL